MKWRVDVGTYNLDVLSKKEMAEAILEYEKGLKELLKGYGELEDYMRGEGCQEWRVAVAVRPQYLLKAEIEWIGDFKKKMRQ